MVDTGDGPSVSVVVLAYRDEPWLEACIDALLASVGLGRLEIVLVDNGCTGGAVEAVTGRPGVTVLRPGTNLGFAGGCNLGAGRATGDVIAFVNSDAIADPHAIRHLADAAREPGVGIATGSIRLAHAPETLNSGGNEVHFLGVGWAGKFGEEASANAEPRPVTSASGAGMAMSRPVWERIGGFSEEYFAYHEDAELSLRCWQQGLAVAFTPQAVIVHHYEFSRNADKFYLLERNRLLFLLTLYEGTTLLALAPLLATFEVAVLAQAAAGGWAGQKIAGWKWLVRNQRWVRRRRRQLQAARTVPDADLLHLFATRLDAGHFPLPDWLTPADALISGYWAVARATLRRRRR